MEVNDDQLLKRPYVRTDFLTGVRLFESWDDNQDGDWVAVNSDNVRIRISHEKAEAVMALFPNRTTQLRRTGRMVVVLS